MAGSIYDTPEMYAWCRDFKHDEYLAVHSRMGLKSVPLTEKSYSLIGEAFYNQMVETFDAEMRRDVQEGVAGSGVKGLGDVPDSEEA